MQFSAIETLEKMIELRMTAPLAILTWREMIELTTVPLTIAPLEMNELLI